MCERRCPLCRSSNHYAGYGLSGSYIVCEDCGYVFLVRADFQAAPIDLTEDQADRWVAERSFHDWATQRGVDHTPPGC